jgi:hypothetical protein
LGGALLIAAQLVRPINTNLYIAASILEAAGFSPLLLGTLGFLRTMYVDNNLNIFFVTDCFPSGKNSFSEHGRMPNVFVYSVFLASLRSHCPSMVESLRPFQAIKASPTHSATSGVFYLLYFAAFLQLCI